jgi:fused signal recognition particle receptor
VIWGFGKKKKEQQAREEEERRIREEDEARARAREERARAEAETRAREEAERQARVAAEARARAEAEAEARAEEEERARIEAAAHEAEAQALAESMFGGMIPRVDEDAERLAREEQERRRQEEAARLAREEEERRQREEEAARLAREQEERRQREEAERLAREQEERRRQEEAARLAREEEELRRQEEAARLAREEEERRQQEEAARLAREEEERRQQEEAARLAREEEERRQREEAARLAREEEERRQREEAEQKARKKGRRLEEAEPEEPALDPNLHHIEWGENPRKKKKDGGGGFFARLRQGLTRSSTKISRGITEHMVTARLDDEALEYLEDVLIQSDLGVKTAGDLIQSLSRARFGPNPTEQEVREHFAGELAKLLEPVAVPLAIRKQPKPHVVLVVGVNGSGKTTTIGKMARQLTDWDIQVSLAAGDTFRAAAVEQLRIWGERTDCPVVARKTGADAAGLAFDAIQEARDRNDDVLLIDTAGRLQNRAELMDELKKVVRVIKKLDETAPHTVLLVIDATVGQNAVQQVKVFQEMVGVTGLAVTKLDGTAKGGVVLSLAEQFGLPIHFVGIGEAVEDLRPFRADEFASSLMGL